jgi:ATP-dependent Clp protease ATP-binding subunit ClpA
LGAAEYERFSDAAHRAVVRAEREARQAGHAVAGPEHLLLALLLTDADVRERLRAIGVSEESVRGRLGTGSGDVTLAVFSPALRRAVHLAGRLATKDRSATIACSHLADAVLEIESLHPAPAAAVAPISGFPQQQVLGKTGTWFSRRRDRAVL